LSKDHFWDYEDFFNWHGNEKEFLFVDRARKDRQNSAQEFFAKFSGEFSDKTLNACVFDNSVVVMETFRKGQVIQFDDTTPPAVAIDAFEGGPVSGDLDVTGTATDNVIVVSVQLYVDTTAVGSLIVPRVSDGYFASIIDTTAFPNGTYDITAVATDWAGNQTTSAARTIAFNN
jgi:hypothetical protein